MRTFGMDEEDQGDYPLEQVIVHNHEVPLFEPMPEPERPDGVYMSPDRRWVVVKKDKVTRGYLAAFPDDDRPMRLPEDYVRVSER
jgi:hypothetical protein